MSGFQWRRTADPDVVAATWVTGGAFHCQPLTLREAARWARAEWFEPEHPCEIQTLAEIEDALAATAAWGDQLAARRDALVNRFPELKARQ